MVVTAMSTDCYSFFVFFFAFIGESLPMEAGSRMSPDTKAPKSGMFLEGGGQNLEVLLGLNVVQGGRELVYVFVQSVSDTSEMLRTQFQTCPGVTAESSASFFSWCHGRL